jgi:hypothetical protein
MNGKWQPLTDNQPTLAIGALALDPTDSNTLYAGTGNDWLGFGSQPGHGILFTHNALANSPSWYTLTDPSTRAVSLDNVRFNSIVIDATNHYNVLAGTEDGIWQSADGGQTWNQRVGSSGSSIKRANIGWVVAQPPDYNKDDSHKKLFYAATGDPTRGACDGAVLVSPDSGQSWTVTKGISGNGRDNPMRVGLGIGKDDFANAVFANCKNGGALDQDKVYVTQSANQLQDKWEAKPDTFSGNCKSQVVWDWLAPNPCDPSYTQGDYDNVVAVDPKNHCVAYFAGVFLMEFQTNCFLQFGANWDNHMNTGPHADYHAIAFSPDSSQVYVGTDGGVWRTTITHQNCRGDQGCEGSGFGTWQELNAGLGAIQYYSGDADSSHILGGAQDNGNIGDLPGPSWQTLTPNEDGSYVTLDGQHKVFYMEEDSSLQIGSYSSSSVATQIGCFQRQSKGGSEIDTGVCAGTPAYPIKTPFILRQPNVLFGTDRLYEQDASGGWAAVSGPVTSGAHAVTGVQSDCRKLAWPFPAATGSDCVTAMATGSGTDDVALGSDLGEVYLHDPTTPLGAGSPSSGWIDITGNLKSAYPTPSTKTWVPWITGIALNPKNKDEAWVTLGVKWGQASPARVWHTTNATAGTSTEWVTLGDSTSGIPPEVTVTGIALDPSPSGDIYISTTSGVFQCVSCRASTPSPTPGAGVWQPLGAKLPNLWVSSVTISQDGQQLLAWTFGRGVWAFSLSTHQYTFFVSCPSSGELCSPPLHRFNQYRVDSRH